MYKSESKNLNSHTNLRIVLEKQRMNHLNYSNALWDFEFHIAQISKILPNHALLPA